ncbi:hypothetical protein WICPIJ_005537 [Wickerhamomyces pijperi]|uniref:Uncharacterized protein n=1 Tax=Wickerhamomyces pijperi TaxID=599730 RepID=A0A9P8Q626_WICPI|nr:hypothetical protein WICPIJ_005537 [Wickerhamomyces pijperi]
MSLPEEPQSVNLSNINDNIKKSQLQVSPFEPSAVAPDHVKSSLNTFGSANFTTCGQHNFLNGLSHDTGAILTSWIDSSLILIDQMIDYDLSTAYEASTFGLMMNLSCYFQSMKAINYLKSSKSRQFMNIHFEFIMCEIKFLDLDALRYFTSLNSDIFRSIRLRVKETEKAVKSKNYEGEILERTLRYFERLKAGVET